MTSYSIVHIVQRRLRTDHQVSRFGGRQIRYLGVEGVGWRYNAESRDDPDGICLPEGFMEACDYENSNLPSRGRGNNSNVGRYEARDAGTDGESSESRKEKWIKTVEIFLNNYICAPVRNALWLNEWRTLPGHIDVNKQCYKVSNVIEDIEFKYLSYTVRDFYALYSKSDKIVYFKCLTMEEYNRRYLSLRE